MELPKVSEWTAELRRLHAEYLETDRQVQARENLITGNGAMCCLGVLAVGVGGMRHETVDGSDSLCHLHDPDSVEFEEGGDPSECEDCCDLIASRELTVFFEAEDYGVSYYSDHSLPPPEFMYCYGMTPEGLPLSQVHDNPTLMSLVSMNDEAEMSFKDIAVVIDEWYMNGWIHDPKKVLDDTAQ